MNISKPKAIVFDFSWVLLHPKNRNYKGKLNDLNRINTQNNPLGAYITTSFGNEFVINTMLIKEIKRIKERYKIPVYMFTTDVIQERSEVQRVIKNVFDRIFTAREIVDLKKVTATDLDKAKTEISAFKYIAEEINLPGGIILYVDDKPQNLAVAKDAKVGFEIYEYKKEVSMEESNRKLFKVLENLFPKI